MIGRREFITLLGGAAAWPVAAQAQKPPIPVVGFLHFASPSVYGPRIAAFREALSAAGYVEGKNVIIDLRPATSVHDFQQAALQLIASNVSLIVASGSEAVSAARQATQTIPIVMNGASDPLGTGFVKSLARPGGNITGFSLLNPQASGLSCFGRLSQTLHPQWSCGTAPTLLPRLRSEKPRGLRWRLGSEF